MTTTRILTKELSDSSDPILLEVVRYALNATADEMAVALQRAAYSTNIKTRLDFSCAIFDRSARIIAQSFGQPNHLGSLTHFVPQILKTYGADRLVPGDGLLCNGGRYGGVHLNDVCLVAPVFVNGAPFGYVASLAHHVDIGGSHPGSISGLSLDSYQDGLTIPPVRLLRDGQIEQDLFNFIINNIRSPRETGGDLRAQVAAVSVATRRLTELINRYGLETLNQIIEHLLDYTERRARQQLLGIPAGVYRAEGFMDDDGVNDIPVRIVVSIEVQKGKVVFDLTGSDEQRPCAINATYAMTLSSCAYILRALMSDDVPVNEGFYRVFEVIAPERSIVNARPPAAIGGGWETAFRVLETGFQALASGIPELLTAGSKGCLCNIAFGGRGRGEQDEYFVFYEAMGGGYGARMQKDGIDAVQPHVQNTENAPVEETEANYPVRIERYELIPDSEGAGRQRGGLGLRRDYHFEKPVTFSVLADRRKFAPWGLAGGHEARAAKFILNPESEHPRELSSKTTIGLAAGDVISIQLGGGGGYGPPWERDVNDVVADVVAGKVSLERARDVYGVEIERNTWQVNADATVARRELLRQF